MAEITVRCPDCGSEISIEEDRAFCFCGECGRQILLAEAAKAAAEGEEAKPEAVPAEQTDKPSAPEEKPAEAPALTVKEPEVKPEPAEAPAPAAKEPEMKPEPASVPPVPMPEAPDGQPAPVPPEMPPMSEAPAGQPAPAPEMPPVPPVPGEAPAGRPEPAPKRTPAMTFPVIPSRIAPEKAPGAEALSAEQTDRPPVPVPKPTGYAAELDRLFREQRYQEAYEGYTSYLEAHPGDIRSLYRQGITAVYLSEGNIIRTAELRSSAGAAVNAMNKTGDRSLAPEKDEDLLELLRYMTENSVTFTEKFASREECASQANGWVALTGLYLEAAPLITSEVRREEAYKAGVEFCDRALAFKSSYFSGSAKAAGEKAKEEYTIYSLDKKQRQAVKDARKRMAESFNSLGSRTAEETRLNEDAAATDKNISRLKTDIRHTNEKYKTARKLFLLESPEVKAGRGRILRNSLIIGGVVLLALALFAFLVIRRERTFFFILLLLLAAAFIVLARSLISKSLIKYEAERYPEGLKALYDRLEDDKKQLKASRKHASRAKEALQRFNRSKL